MTQQLVPKYKFEVLPKLILCLRSSRNLLVQTVIYIDNLRFHGLDFLDFLCSLIHFPEVHSVYNVTWLNTFPHVFLCPKNGSALVRALSWKILILNTKFCYKICGPFALLTRLKI